MTCWSSAVWMVVKNNYRIDFEITKGTKIAKIQSTKYTKQTISLADVGLGADEFVSLRACKMNNIRRASVCSAIFESALRDEKKHKTIDKVIIDVYGIG